MPRRFTDGAVIADVPHDHGHDWQGGFVSFRDVVNAANRQPDIDNHDHHGDGDGDGGGDGGV